MIILRSRIWKKDCVSFGYPTARSEPAISSRLYKSLVEISQLFWSYCALILSKQNATQIAHKWCTMLHLSKLFLSAQLWFLSLKQYCAQPPLFHGVWLYKKLDFKERYSKINRKFGFRFFQKIRWIAIWFLSLKQYCPQQPPLLHAGWFYKKPFKKGVENLGLFFFK